MGKLTIEGTLPDELMATFLQYMRDFDSAHPECHFQLITVTDQSNEEIDRILRQIDPPFDIHERFRKQ